MKKLLMSKKALAASALALMLAMGGITYAWFTTSSTAQGSQIQVGTLGIEAKFNPINDPSAVYEPDSSASITGTVKSTGSISVISKAATAGMIYKNGVAMETITSDKTKNVYLELDESKIGYDLDKGVFWLKDKNTGDYYLVQDVNESVSGDTTAKVGLTVQFTGKMGNEYQGTVVDFSSVWDGTQARDGAVLSKWSVNYADLLPVFKDISEPGGFRAFSAPITEEELIAKVHAIFER